ncbi:polyprenyl synthetase family protein [Streptomyces sp. NPDC127068]|uniref:polyprenyl synthetase family protein n=1 Tax=Streptomyces sp. NPDC127068 TaxID=3347127 RepID=UPI003656525C
MAHTSTAPVPLDLSALRVRIEAKLTGFLDQRHPPEIAASVLKEFVAAGGKRLRPLLCVLGRHCAGALGPVPQAVIDTAAALELFHASALIHDDIMDNSDTRRQRPTVHRQLTAHARPGSPADAARRLGEGHAILVGDLAQVWADEILHTADLTNAQFQQVLTVWDTMRAEVIHGQLLDLASSGRPTDDVHRALSIVRLKTATYTIERPLHLGAVLTGASPGLLTELSRLALPLGEAYQLRDDLLGVFGDPRVTGKSRLDDLREGKHTVLVAIALQEAVPRHAAVLHRLLGEPGLTEADAERIRHILTITGARRHVEEMIEGRRREVLELLRNTELIHPAAIAHLRDLTESATRRTA